MGGAPGTGRGRRHRPPRQRARPVRVMRRGTAGCRSATVDGSAGPCRGPARGHPEVSHDRDSQPVAPAPARPGMSAGRVVALVFGVLVLLLASVLLLAGGALLWADVAERTDGYLLSPEDTLTGRLRPRQRADRPVHRGGLDARLGGPRHRPGRGDRDVRRETFIGIASVSDATAYLGGVERTVIDDSAWTRPVAGGARGRAVRSADRSGLLDGAGLRSGDPAADLGAGGRRLDARRHERRRIGRDLVDARIGATLPALDGLGRGLLIAGVVCVVIGVLLLVLAIRRPADRLAGCQPVPWQVPPGAGRPAAGRRPAPALGATGPGRPGRRPTASRPGNADRRP